METFESVKRISQELSDLILENEKYKSKISYMITKQQNILSELLMYKQEEFDKLKPKERRDILFKEYCLHCRNKPFNATKPCKRFNYLVGRPELGINNDGCYIKKTTCENFEWS